MVPVNKNEAWVGVKWVQLVTATPPVQPEEPEEPVAVSLTDSEKLAIAVVAVEGSLDELFAVVAGVYAKRRAAGG